MTSQPDYLRLAGGGEGPQDHTLTVEEMLLVGLGFRRKALAVGRDIARRRGTTIAISLIQLGYLQSSIWWKTVARHLGVRYFSDLYLIPKAPDAAPPDARFFQQVRQVWHQKSDAAVLVVAPLGGELDRLTRDIAADPSMRRRLAIAAPATIRRAVRRSYEPVLTYQAVNRLRLARPRLSAAFGASMRRRILVGFALAGLLAVAAPLATLAVFDLLFLIAGGLRLAAALHAPTSDEAATLPDDALPSYSILVPLFHEARVVGELVRSLTRIDYPTDRLSIHLVVEADDRATRIAAESAAAGSRLTVIAVPPSLPRTKPKALSWALPFTDGELLTVYDAEDRPQPDQLRRAAAAFAAGPPDLVCLQAMLDIDHASGSCNWFARQFTLEYRVLFRAVLPFLARHESFLPLGGTSNHFRRAALVASGAWDPFNVTEDADLAVRLQRDGGRIGVIASVTTEEAPLSWRAWHAQRTRWMKGWLQTWLVHMRQPRRLLHELGPRKFAAFQVLILGQILSALIYPFGVTLILLWLVGVVPLFADRDFPGDLLLAFQLLALGIGWLGAMAAMLRTGDVGGNGVKAIDLATMPLYWLLLFAATITAIAELIVDPHRWNKTTHGVAERSASDKSRRFPPRQMDDIDRADAEAQRVNDGQWQSPGPTP